LAMDAFVGEALTVLFIILAYSYLIKDNIGFQFVQATYVGFGVGHSLVMVVKYFSENTFPSITSGNILLVVPLLVGLLLFGRLVKGYLWLYRYPLAILVGVGLGLQLRGMLKANLIDQIISTMNVNLSATVDGFNSIIIFIFVLVSMNYFFFTYRGRQGSGTIGSIQNLLMKSGQYVLMGAFGAGFAAAFLSRLAVFMGIIEQVVTFFGLI